MDQVRILCIETSSRICSVALTVEGKCFFKESDGEEHVHAAVLHDYVSDVLEQAQMKTSELQAVAIGAGPGSYTGLRIGVSAAKGLCFALSLPLIALNSLEVLAHEMIKKYPDYDIYRPVFDARRMEVYTLGMSVKGAIIEHMAPRIVDEQLWKQWEAAGKTLISGDATEKLCGKFVSKHIISADDLTVSARYMPVLAYRKLIDKEIEDVRSYQPVYLKPVHTTKAKDPLARNR